MLAKIGPQKTLRILITGTTGLVGSALSDFLKSMGHQVFSLIRKKRTPSRVGDIVFNPLNFQGDRSQLEGFDAVIHLAGESIQKRWTRKRKEKILKSREEMTRHLVKMLASLEKPPPIFLCASAVGFYGERGDVVLTEKDSKGKGFLAEVCQAWETASSFLNTSSVRVVHLRFGIILSSKGGALKKMLTPFKLGLGATLGNGAQFISWVAIDDVIGAIYHTLLNQELKGPVNVVSPQAVTNLEFTKTLASRLYKPYRFSISPTLSRLLIGEGAKELLFTSTRAYPQKLLDTGYTFRYPDLTSALSHLVY